jgi:hypothetical protein
MAAQVVKYESDSFQENHWISIDVMALELHHEKDSKKSVQFVYQQILSQQLHWNYLPNHSM